MRKKSMVYNDKADGTYKHNIALVRERQELRI